MYKLSLMIFRQDLRIQDNTALREAILGSKKIIPLFIRDTRSIQAFGENDPRCGLIQEALEAINYQIGGCLRVARGNPEEILEQLFQKYPIEAVYTNSSYNFQGKQRDSTLETLCKKHDISWLTFHDFLMIPPDVLPTRKVFTPFSLLWKKHIASINTTPQQTAIQGTEWVKIPEFQTPSDAFGLPQHPYWTLDFGVQRMARNFNHYDELRNIPSLDGSTRLSPYIRFGIYSIREIYVTVKDNPPLLSEIIWREFWYHIQYHFPETRTLAFQEKRRNIAWETESPYWQKFRNAETGYPLVDAAIRQLQQTHWMHNRLRMVVASFLTKNLAIHWSIGEQWFKEYLIDYDEAVNIGNWQWSASIGADPKPIRIFNPLLQSERFDPDALFIKKYLPELQGVDPKRIHTLDLEGIYHKPIIDQKISAAQARERYKEAQ